MIFTPKTKEKLEKIQSDIAIDIAGGDSQESAIGRAIAKAYIQGGHDAIIQIETGLKEAEK